jgi:hypothetical protein
LVASTSTSKTYRRSDGTFVTRFFAQKADAAADVNGTAEGFEAAAGELKASFPATLTGRRRDRRARRPRRHREAPQ